MENYLKAEVSASAVAHNLSLLRKCLSPRTKLCAVLKADAYGHSVDLLLNVFARHSDHLAVATPAEAVHLRDLGSRAPLLAFFSPCASGCSGEAAEAMEELISRDVTLTAVSAEEILVLASAARKVGSPAKVHLKVDTGMGRRGLSAGKVNELVEALRAHREVKLTGIYTHFACADESDKACAREQLAVFRQAFAAAGIGADICRHAANSAATIDLPESHLDMVRPGIAMYGYQPSDEMHNKLDLKPALRLTGPLVQVKTLPAGSRCGYGLVHKFGRDSVVGLVPIGYGDGYFRCLSGKATMRVAGRNVPICGRVSMDQIILDLTDAPWAKVGDEVEILSNDPSAPHSVENIARLAGTIAYEITCRLGGRIRRVLVD